MNRWNPFRELDEVLQAYQRSVWPARHNASLGADHGREPITRAEWSPAVDISETDSAYIVKAELPGVQRNAIKLTVHDRVLLLSGERILEKQSEDVKHHRIERFYGSFARSFSLPEDANEQDVSADYKEGVLIVRVAKTTKPQPRTIEIKSETEV